MLFPFEPRVSWRTWTRRAGSVCKVHSRCGAINSSGSYAQVRLRLFRYRLRACILGAICMDMFLSLRYNETLVDRDVMCPLKSNCIDIYILLHSRSTLSWHKSFRRNVKIYGRNFSILRYPLRLVLPKKIYFFIWTEHKNFLLPKLSIIFFSILSMTLIRHRIKRIILIKK